MAMTVQQAQQLVNAQEGQQTDSKGRVADVPGLQTDANGNPVNWYSQDEINEAQNAYDQNTATLDQLAILVDQGLITDAAARSYAQKQQTADQKANANKPMVYHAPTKSRAAYYTDPDTGTAYDLNGNIIAQAPGDQNAPPYFLAQNGMPYAPGTGGPDVTGGALGGVSSGVDHYATDQSIAMQLRDLAEKQREFGLNLAEQQRQFDLQNELANRQAQAANLQSRATTGLNLADLQRGLANDVYQRALDPGNYPAYLAASAGLPQGAGSPISALIGQGVQIQPPGGSNPLADPRFQGLMDQLYGYAQPQSLSTVQNIAAQHGGQLPPEFYKYTGTTPPAHASGGSQMLNGPVVGVNMTTGQPEFIAGEAGREMVTFTPMHTHETNGAPMPHQHDYGEQSHEHMGNVIRFADGGAVIAGTGPTQHQLIAAWNAYHPDNQMADVLTPAEGTAISAGKAIGNLGYAPNYLTQQLMEGRTPTPGSLDEATLARLPPSIRALLQAQVRSALGGAGLMDYNAELQNQQFAGLNSGRTATYYQ